MSDHIESWCKNTGFKVIGKLPFDTGVVEAMVQGQSIIEYDINSIVSRMIIEIWNKILNTN